MYDYVYLLARFLWCITYIYICFTCFFSNRFFFVLGWGSDFGLVGLLPPEDLWSKIRVERRRKCEQCQVVKSQSWVKALLSQMPFEVLPPHGKIRCQGTNKTYGMKE